MHVSDSALREIFGRTRIIAVVGFSPEPDRASHYVAAFLRDQGYRVIPVNPGQAGRRHLGEICVARLSDIPADIPVDMVDIFRRPDAVPAVVDEALRALPHLKTIWMQIGVAHPATAARARGLGLDVVQNRCPKIEIPRLYGAVSPLATV